MQNGVSLDEFEIRELIAARVAELTGETQEYLTVYVTCWNGRLSTCVTHIDGKTGISLTKGESNAN